MRLTIEIDMANAAFEDDPGELGRILNVAAQKAGEKLLEEPEYERKLNLQDVNGNTVGHLRLVEVNLQPVECGTCGWTGIHHELECYRDEAGNPVEVEYARCPKCFDEDQVYSR